MGRAGCCCETLQKALLVPFVCPHRHFCSCAGRRWQQLNSLRATLLPRAGKPRCLPNLMGLLSAPFCQNPFLEPLSLLVSQRGRKPRVQQAWGGCGASREAPKPPFQLLLCPSAQLLTSPQTLQGFQRNRTGSYREYQGSTLSPATALGIIAQRNKEMPKSTEPPARPSGELCME